MSAPLQYLSINHYKVISIIIIYPPQLLKKLSFSYP